VVDCPFPCTVVGKGFGCACIIDAQDLIGLIQRHDPASPAEFDAWIRSRGGYLVLTGTNVVEASVFLRESGRSSERRGELGSLLRAVANLS